MAFAVCHQPFKNVRMNDFNANLELQHIYLEAYAERYHSLRQYFEAYYCYRHGLITRQGKPDWGQIFQFAPHSHSAKACTDKKQCVRELWLPLSVLVGRLKALVRDDELTVEAIQDLLDDALHYVIVSREEWNALKKNGWVENMPAEFYQPQNPHYQDPHDRFTRLGIAFEQAAFMR